METKQTAHNPCIVSFAIKIVQDETKRGFSSITVSVHTFSEQIQEVKCFHRHNINI